MTAGKRRRDAEKAPDARRRLQSKTRRTAIQRAGDLKTIGLSNGTIVIIDTEWLGFAGRQPKKPAHSI